MARQTDDQQKGEKPKIRGSKETKHLPTAAFVHEPNLTADYVPISGAAAQLAARIERSRVSGAPQIVTRKGYPDGVILHAHIYDQLLTQAGVNPRQTNAQNPPTPSAMKPGKAKRNRGRNNPQ